MVILVTSGAGYIGSHINKLLACEGYDTVVFDNLADTLCCRTSVAILEKAAA